MSRCDYAACPRPGRFTADGWLFCRAHFLTHAEDREVGGYDRGRFERIRGRLGPVGHLGPLLNVLSREQRQAGAA